VQSWWRVAGVAAICSQVLIVLSWSDAKFGTIANLIVLIPVVVGFCNTLPSALPRQYRELVGQRLHPIADTSLVSEADLRHLPAPVQTYLRYVGAVGKPKVVNFRAVSRGTMKRTMESDWMEITAEQHNFYDERARLFFIQSAIFGVPFDGLHAYVADSATMLIRVAAMVTVADARGATMNRSETVTMFNDMCLMAPATLIDPTIAWEAVDSLTVRARFTNRSNTISALLSFNAAGEMVNFLSNDRYLSGDGKTYTSYPWSTPVRNYTDFAGRKVPAYGEALWHTPKGEFCYARYSLLDITYNHETPDR